jgi:serine/threonine protein kinase
VWAERYDGWTELGHGGSASVVRTRSKALGEDIALKIFPRLAADEWGRFQEEVRNAQRLTSPYIVRTYSPFPRGSFAWIELELIEGPNLRQELERRTTELRPFSLEEAVEIAAGVAHALVAAHDAGITHRDVKPANILLPSGGRPVAKLSDFGISRLTGAARLTKTGLLVGTPQFAAPEVIAGQLGGPASDVYSLTLCLYLMLSGNRPPFEIHDETSPTQWMRAHTDQRPQPIAAFQPRVPEALAALIEQGLAKEPEQRPTSHEVLELLSKLQVVGETGLLRGPRRRPAWGFGTGAAAVALVLAGLGVLWRVQADRPQGGADLRAAAMPEPTPTAPSIAVSTPVSSSPASPAPAAPPPPGATPSPKLSLRAALRGDVLTLSNAGSERIDDLRVALVAGGHRYSTRVLEGLAAGEELYLSLEDLTPAPPPDLKPDHVEVLAAEGGARRTLTIPLQ